MAQIMKFWNYPTTGTGWHYNQTTNYGNLFASFGNTTYQWSSMPIQLSSSSTSAQIDAVATLMYHCGISVNMKYGPSSTGGSSANTLDVATSLINYFGYSKM
jgi:hypothetical protein